VKDRQEQHLLLKIKNYHVLYIIIFLILSIFLLIVSEYGWRSQNFYDPFYNFSKSKLPLKFPFKQEKNIEAEFLALKNMNFVNLICIYARQYLSLYTYVSLNIPDAKNFTKISKEGSFKTNEAAFDIEQINFNDYDDANLKLSKKKNYFKFFNFFKNNPAYLLILVFILLLVFYSK